MPDILEYLRECLAASKEAGKMRPTPDTLWRVTTRDFEDAGYPLEDLPSRYAFRGHFGNRHCDSSYDTWGEHDQT